MRALLRSGLILGAGGVVVAIPFFIGAIVEPTSLANAPQSPFLGSDPSSVSSVSSVSSAPLPRRGLLDQPPVRSSSVTRIPPGLLRSAERLAAPWSPGLRLRAVHRRDEWAAHRAEIEDRATKDVRAYAIGDLLPHGSMLVAIDERSVDIFVADRELVRLNVDGSFRSVDDFSTRGGRTRGPAPMTRAEGMDDAYRRAVTQAIESLASEDEALVQRIIDRLIDGGDPVVELLVPYADREDEVASGPFAFPSGGRTRTPRALGDIVVGILERITGQSFGDPMTETTTPDDRARIARAWAQWWQG
ncbi:MAG: hypothetical protein IPK13_05400 [Deltaproteobacteria bacterium]|nr:hypothetical protein [Deltaproteobacteria bacterium]